MIETTTTAPELLGDFASGQHSVPTTPDADQDASRQGDFAAGERIETPTQEDPLEAGLHGDFAAGERTEPLTPADDDPGSFADTAR